MAQQVQTVLVTGATGFVGSHVIPALINRGVQVVASSATPAKAATMDWWNKVTYLSLDMNALEEDKDYFAWFGKPDMVIHLAWEGLPNYKADFHLTENLPKQQLFLQNLLKNGLKNLTVAGTCFEYGKQEGCLSEEMAVYPDNAYGIAKNELRQYLEQKTAEVNCSFKWLRLFYMYGKGQSPKSLISQLDQALASGATDFNMSGGEQVRDFLPIEKVAHYIVSAAMQDEVNGIINCCSGIPVTVRSFVEQYLQSAGKQIRLNLGFYPYADYEAMRFWGSNIKIKKLTGQWE